EDVDRVRRIRDRCIGLGERSARAEAETEPGERAAGQEAQQSATRPQRGRFRHRFPPCPGRTRLKATGASSYPKNYTGGPFDDEPGAARPRGTERVADSGGYARSRFRVLEYRLLAKSWGRSSAGRAPRSQCGGQGFDPP